HLSLFRGLTNLYKTQSEKDITDKSVVEGDPKESETNDALNSIRKINLKNVLFFWVRSGYMPWWAGNFRDLPASVLFDTLIQEFPEDAILLFKHSGINANTRRRIVFQIPSDTLLRVLKLFPGG